MVGSVGTTILRYEKQCTDMDAQGSKAVEEMTMHFFLGGDEIRIVTI